MRPVRVGILGSGRGSNFKALWESFVSTESPVFEPVVVLSDHEEAGILALAAEYGVEHYYLDPGTYRTRLSEEAEITYLKVLQKSGVELLVLAGFMRMLKGSLLRAFEGRLLNIHPSLLPQFPGLAAWEQAWKAGVSETGCTVHQVDAGMDTGTILAQEKVVILSGETSEQIHHKIQEAEHRLYPRVVAAVAQRIQKEQLKNGVE
jgi:phosphoribosylglycinamide formyltransferase 1